MNNRWRTILFILLAVGQVAFARHYHSLRFTVDLLFLVIFFIAIRSGFMTSILSAALIGFCSDYLSGGVMGVFSFSRTLAAFSLNAVARFLDLKKNIFIFLLILFSLFLSNLAAFGFLVLIFRYQITFSLLVIQPLSTALLGTIILGSKKAKSLLDVS
ncbi:MAG: rod shape-determining protein MreD [Acidobacteria bacterium]|jgi:rod shape-determining protein MreD|nr:rod shape-determining protein MreD [Acidobacteriota bacterium]